MSNKEDILKEVIKYFGTTDNPEDFYAMFILPDGRFMYTDMSPDVEEDEYYDDFEFDGLSSRHNNVDDFMIEMGYVEPKDKSPFDETIFQTLFNAIRFQVADEDVSYLTLPQEKPTSQQYNSILKVLDLAERTVGSIEICETKSGNRGIRYYFNDWDDDANNIYTTDEVLKKIKRYYASGTLYEDLDKDNINEALNKGLLDNIINKLKSMDCAVTFLKEGWYDDDYNFIDVEKMSDEEFDNFMAEPSGDYLYFDHNQYDVYTKGKTAGFEFNLEEDKKRFIVYVIWSYSSKQEHKGEASKMLYACLDLLPNDYTVVVDTNENRPYWNHIASKYPNLKFINESFDKSKEDKSLNESYMRLDEATRNQLINKTKNSDNYKDTSKGKNRYERRTKSRIANSVAQYNKVDMDALFKRDILTLGVDVHGETNDYVVTVRFIGLLKELQREVKANNNKLEYKCIARAMSRVFNTGDVSLHCTCPDYKFRLAFWSSKNNYGTQYEPRPSDITNPNDTKGGGCKHCMLVLSNLDWMMKISSVINNYIKYCQNNMEYNYATYIFPKVYGMPYKQAVQTSMFDNGGYLPSDQKTVGDVAKTNTAEKDDKGRFIVGNKYRFNKKQNGELEEPNKDQIKFNFDEKPKEVVPDENSTK